MYPVGLGNTRILTNYAQKSPLTLHVDPDLETISHVSDLT